MSHYLYIFQDLNSVKIGHTNNYKRRFNEHSTSNPNISIYKIYDADSRANAIKIETELKKCLSNKKTSFISQEWFNITPELLETHLLNIIKHGYSIREHNPLLESIPLDNKGAFLKTQYRESLCRNNYQKAIKIEKEILNHIGSKFELGNPEHDFIDDILYKYDFSINMDKVSNYDDIHSKEICEIRNKVTDGYLQFKYWDHTRSFYNIIKTKNGGKIALESARISMPYNHISRNPSNVKEMKKEAKFLGFEIFEKHDWNLMYIDAGLFIYTYNTPFSLIINKFRKSILFQIIDNKNYILNEALKKLTSFHYEEFKLFIELTLKDSNLMNISDIDDYYDNKYMTEHLNINEKEHYANEYYNLLRKIIKEKDD